MHGEIGDRIAVVDEDVEIGERAERGSEQRRFAALAGRNTGGSNAGAQGDLGERIHAAGIVNAFHPLVSRDRFCGKCIAAAGYRDPKMRGMSWSDTQSSPHESGEQRIPDASQIRAQLRRIVESRDFPASERNRRFFQRVVENSLEGKRTSAREVAVDVFGRPAPFDSIKDPIVRIEAAKLRRDLETYYLKSGKHDRIRLSFAKGRYVVRWQYNDSALPDADPSRGSLLILRAALLGLSGADGEARTAWRAVLQDFPDFSLNPQAHAAVQAICGQDRRVRELVLEGLRRATSADQVAAGGV